MAADQLRNMPKHNSELREIQQIAIAIRRRTQPVKEMRHQADVVGVDLGQVLEARRVVLMVRQRMVRFRHADLGIRPRALFLA